MPAIYCRESEHTELCSFLYERWMGLHSDALFMSGSPGSGKSMSIDSLAQNDVTAFPVNCPDAYAKIQTKFGRSRVPESSSTPKTDAVRTLRVNCADLSSSALQSTVLEAIDKFTKKSVLQDRTNSNASTKVGAKTSERVSQIKERVESMCVEKKLPATGARRMLVLALDEIDFTTQKGAAQSLVQVVLASSQLSNFNRYCGLVLIFISNSQEKVVDWNRIRSLTYAPYTKEQALEIQQRRATATESTIPFGVDAPPAPKTKKGTSPAQIEFSKSAQDLISRRNNGDARELRDLNNAAVKEAQDRHEKTRTERPAVGTSSQRQKRNRGEPDVAPVLVGPADVIAVEKQCTQMAMLLEGLSPEMLIVLVCCVRLVRERLALKASGALVVGANPRLLTFTEVWAEIVKFNRALNLHVTNAAVIGSHISAFSDYGFATLPQNNKFQVAVDETELLQALAALKDRGAAFMAAYDLLTEGDKLKKSTRS